VQPVGRFPAFYGTRRFISELTRALHVCHSDLVVTILAKEPEVPDSIPGAQGFFEK
jgi:hypothetical protein